jgi:hypothetical protein
MTAEFLADDDTYNGGVSLTTGWVAGAEGGAKSIITGQLSGDGTVRVWSAGSRLNGEPAMYTESPGHHSGAIDFAEIAAFAPFTGAGVTVATTSTTTGADLLVSAATDNGVQIGKFSLGRADPGATTVTPTLLDTMTTTGAASGSTPAATGPAPLAGR